MNRLLEIPEWVSTIETLISDKWAEFLGWLAIPSVAIAIIVGIFKLIISKSTNKKTVKLFESLKSELETFKATLDENLNKLNIEVQEKMKLVCEDMSKKVDDIFKQYQKTKVEAYKKIKGLDVEVKKTLDEIKENTEIINEIVEEVVEETQIEEETAEIPTEMGQISTNEESLNNLSTEEKQENLGVIDR